MRDYVTRGHVESGLENAPIVATDPLAEPSAAQALSVDQLYTVALRTRPDAAQVKIQLDNAEISLQGSQNGMRLSSTWWRARRTTDWRDP